MIKHTSIVLFCLGLASGASKTAVKQNTIDAYIEQAISRSATSAPASPGSLYSPTGLLADPARDWRASRVDEIVTVLVADRASAISKGATKSERTSAAAYNVGPLLGTVNPKLSDLARLSGENKLNGQGETSRENILSTVLSARVTHVLPNGLLVIQGSKTVAVNSEAQLIEIRGILRPNDLTSDNVIRSDRLAELEVKVNGRGVVGDAIKRPFFLYRILMGLLPF